jgi:Fur family ferric uptake transcriptional regulator
MAKSGHKHRDHHHGSATYIDHCVEALKRSGARITKPRLAVLGCLATARHALTPRELVEKLSGTEDGAEVDQATVYRILEAFAALGLVHRIGPQGAFVACGHLDCDAELHVVTHCNSCERTQEIDLPIQLMASVRKHVQTALKFQPGDHFFQLNGTCAECGVKASSKSD